MSDPSGPPPFDTPPAPSPTPEADPVGPAPAVPDPVNETFRPGADADLDAEVERAMAGTGMDTLMAESRHGAAGVPEARLSGTQAGTVARVDLSKGEVLVDLGGKHQALVPARQYEKPPGEGEFVEVDIERFDTDEGLYRANRKGAARRVAGWDELKVGQVVEATCTGMNKGGLECRVGPTAIRAFMPAGQVDNVFHKDISIFIGQKFPVKIQKVDKAERNLVLSRRAVVESERRDARDKLASTLEEGQVLTGTVKVVKDFGAFVDVGGMDGLLHVSQLTHRRMADANEFIKEGEQIEVRVDKFDKKAGKLSLSRAHSVPNPWESAESKYPPGTQVTGRVTRVENFGVFVELEEGIEALMPVSEMSWRRIRHPSEVVQLGESVRSSVVNLDPRGRKMTLSLKQLGGDPWAEATVKYAADTSHTAKISKLAEFGAFAELEPGIEGLIHISEMSNQRIRRPEDAVRLGQEVQVRVLQVEADKRRIRLSMKERDFAAEAAAAEQGEQRQARKVQREKRLKTKPLRGGLDF